MIVAIINTPKVTLLGYTSIIVDSVRTVLLSWLGTQYEMILSRPMVLILVTLVMIVPLCRIPNLSSLAPFSAAGSAAVVVTAVAMLVRFYDGSYAPGGRYYVDYNIISNDINNNNTHQELDVLAQTPSSNTVDYETKLIHLLHALPFICMVFESWVMHYNTPRYFTELYLADIARFTIVIFISFSITASVYVAIAVTGYLTFYTSQYQMSSQHTLTLPSNILQAYHPNDRLITSCRILMTMAVLLTYPIVFMGFRDAVLDLLNVPANQQSKGYVSRVSWILLCLLTILSIFITDLGLISAVSGGTLTTCIVFVFPALSYRSIVSRRTRAGCHVSQIDQYQVVLVLFLTVVGFILGLTGVVVAVHAYMQQQQQHQQHQETT
jgi:amino acid permease